MSRGKRPGHKYRLQVPLDVAQALGAYQDRWKKKGKEAILHLVLEGLARAGDWPIGATPGVEPPQAPRLPGSSGGTLAPSVPGRTYQFRLPDDVAGALEAYQDRWKKREKEAILQFMLEALARAGFWPPGSA